MVHPGGRPLKFKSPEELKQKVDAYFESCWEEAWDRVKNRDGEYEWVQQVDQDGKSLMRMKERPTITGLAIALETTRLTLIDYQNRNDEYSEIINKAKTLVEYYYEKGANEGAIHPAVGIFALKNFGWTDVVQINTNRTHEQLSVEEIKRQLKERIAELG